MDAYSSAYLIVVAFLFLVILGILWMVLPFAVFGTKPLIQVAINELRTANKHLASIAASLKHLESEVSPPPTPQEPVKK